MSRLVFDEEMAKRLDVVYRSRDVVRRRRIVREAVMAQPGERILDVGCGPGFYVTELLEQVGPEGLVVGLDQSTEMLAAAAERCHQPPNARFEESDATSLPVADGSFDAALSVQVLEYVPEVDAALAELHRVLRPAGRLTLWDVDWETVSWHSADPERMQRVLGAWDAHLAHPSLPRTLAARLRAAGFEKVRHAGHAFTTTALVPDAYIAGIMPVIGDYVAGEWTISEDEVAAWTAEQRELHERGEFYFACIQFCFTATRT